MFFGKLSIARNNFNVPEVETKAKVSVTKGISRSKILYSTKIYSLFE